MSWSEGNPCLLHCPPKTHLWGFLKKIPKTQTSHLCFWMHTQILFNSLYFLYVWVPETPKFQLWWNHCPSDNYLIMGKVNKQSHLVKVTVLFAAMISTTMSTVYKYEANEATDKRLIQHTNFIHEIHKTSKQTK